MNVGRRGYAGRRGRAGGRGHGGGVSCCGRGVLGCLLRVLAGHVAGEVRDRRSRLGSTSESTSFAMWRSSRPRSCTICHALWLRRSIQGRGIVANTGASGAAPAVRSSGQRRRYRSGALSRTFSRRAARRVVRPPPAARPPAPSRSPRRSRPDHAPKSAPYQNLPARLRTWSRWMCLICMYSSIPSMPNSRPMPLCL